MANRHFGRPLIVAGVGITLALVVTLLILEASVRVVSVFIFPRMMVLDDVLGWRHGESRRKVFVNEHGESVVVTHDQFGFRAPVEETILRGGRQRLLVLGDSFTQAIQVADEDVFTTLVARDFPQVDVLNAGISGYSTVQEYIYLTTRGLTFKPDAVLLMFFDNDLDDNCLSYSPGFGPRPYARDRSGVVAIDTELSPVDFDKFILPIPFSEALNRRSYFYNFVNNRIYQPIFAERMKDNVKKDKESARKQCDRMVVLLNVLDRLDDALRSRSIAFGVVLIPDKSLLAGGTSDEHEKIQAHCRERTMSCLSLLPAFHQTTDPTSLYFEQDKHWTRAGHHRAADLIQPLVRELLNQSRVPTSRDA